MKNERSFFIDFMQIIKPAKKLLRDSCAQVHYKNGFIKNERQMPDTKAGGKP